MTSATNPSCLRTLARIIAQPNGLAFLERHGFLGRAGNSERVQIAGRGVVASGRSWQEARHQWIKGAMATADDLEASRDLVDRMGVAQ